MTATAMRTPYKLLIAIIFALFFFGIGNLYQWLNLWFAFPVEINLTNHSGQSIKQINLSFQSGVSGTLNVGSLEVDRSILLKYYPVGEGSFNLEVTLDDGKVLNHTGGYVEAGYSFNQEVTTNAIQNKSDYKLIPSFLFK